MRVRRSYIYAIIIAAFVTGWMFSDDFWPFEGEASPKSGISEVSEEATAGKMQPVTVSAVRVRNELAPLRVRASGVTRTLFEIYVVARRQGIVKEIRVKEGTWVEVDEVLVELDKGTLQAEIDAARADRDAATAVYNDAKKRFGKDGELEVQLRSAEADLAANKKNYEITESLVKSGVQTELALSQKKALLKAAETRLFELKNVSKELELSNSYARLKAIDSNILRLEEQIKFTTIKVPKKGWLEELNVENGEFVDENRPVARILGLQSLVLDMPIPQTSIGKISIGDPVQINFLGLGTRTGRVDKIAAAANESTRTFDVEIELKNPDGLLRAGMTGEASIIVDEVEAFKISPAHLNVNDDGQLTVKVATSEDRVKVVPVQLVRTAGNFAYISGVSDGSLLLTTGQAFLSSGELVSYSMDEGDKD